ncbi:MAG TPA: hypothetical protein VHN98_12020 [Acidimicrobiales bacterium]|nr:hypothetical protein [Acidimicrobiales bacterium]
MRRYLVVANRTLGGPALLRAIDERLATGEPASFRLVVPATPTTVHEALLAGQAAEGGLEIAPVVRAEAEREARERLATELARLRSYGADADGRIGDADVVRAVREAIRSAPEPFDEIILSTLPAGPSRWLALDLPARLRRAVDVAVVVVVAEESDGA